MLKIYNSLTRRKEEFKPLEAGKVKMYACGITVSGPAHIGHLYQALVFDIIRKYLEKCGYKVKYARNWTDVDDKIIIKANELKIDAKTYAEKMTAEINEDMNAMKVDGPTVWVKATGSMNDIINFIKSLIKKGCAYATDEGNVYFSVNKFKDYGKLSGRKVEELLEGVRIDVLEDKKETPDFALWKAAKEGEPFWVSPWGNGRPGWHIECSAMNYKVFGEQIDIHGGGRDLVFPHHEDEIAQTESLTEKNFASYWIHNGLIKVDGQKMSKSLNNSLLIRDLLKEYHPETIKMAILQTSYRSDINITKELFNIAEGHLYEFYKTISQTEIKFGKAKTAENIELNEEFNKAMNDDFNTAKAIALIFGEIKKINIKIKNNDTTAREDILALKQIYGLLGLFKEDADAFILFVESKSNQKEEETPAEITKLAEERFQAKRAKNYKLADELRAKITNLGYNVVDTKEGFEIKKI